MMIALIYRRVRSRTRLYPAFLPFAVVVAFLFSVNVFMDAQTLTGDQEATAELGSAVAQLTLFDIELQAGTPAGDNLRRLAARDDPRVDMSIGAIDFPYYAGGARGIFFRERNWKAISPDTQYRLSDGRWPSQPGEVAIVGERDQVAHVGDEVATLGGGEPLRVVGIGQPRLEGSPTMLAAPGTWAALEVTAEGQTQLTGFPTFELSEGQPTDLVVAVAAALSSPGYTSEFGPVSEELTAGLDAKLRTRAESAAEAKRLWSEQSPLSLRAPGLILVPTTMVIGYLVLMRRFTATARRMVAQGVRTRAAVTGLWLVPVPTIAGLAAAAAAVGTLSGYALSQLGDDRWSYHVANWRLPTAAISLVTVGGIAAIVLGWFVIRARAVGYQFAVRSRAPEKVRRRTKWRQALIGAGACYCMWQALTLNSGPDGFVLLGAAAATTALVTPEFTGLLVRFMPERTLSQRLVARLVAHHQPRMAAAATTYIALVAVTAGFLIVLASYTEELRTRHPSAPPEGQVLVDNDGVTFLGVDTGVRAAIETVPALQEQEPVQFFLIGTRYLSDAGIAEVRGGVGTADYPAVSFAFATVDDIQAAYGRDLSDTERATLTDGGVLVPQPDRVEIRDSQVELVDIGTLESVARLDAVAAEPEPTPWADVPAVMLVSTATALGLPSEPAALLYNGVSKADADAAEQALITSGYSPRLMNKHERPSALVPAAALFGSAVALLLLVVTMSVLMSRAQVQDMRPWAAHLTRIGVPRRWAIRSLRRQYLWVMGCALPIGLVITLATVMFTHLRLPQLDLVVPWPQIAGTVVTIVIATLAGAALAARRLSTFDAHEA
jgi:putative ABC transport system permease protein